MRRREEPKIGERGRETAEELLSLSNTVYNKIFKRHISVCTDKRDNTRNPVHDFSFITEKWKKKMRRP
jgi:hypothetical protein